MLDLAVRSIPNFPGQILGGAGIRVEGLGLTARISLDYRNLQELDESPSGTALLAIQDPETGTFRQAPLDLALLSGSPDIPGLNEAIVTANTAAATAITAASSAAAAAAAALAAVAGIPFEAVQAEIVTKARDEAYAHKFIPVGLTDELWIRQRHYPLSRSLRYTTADLGLALQDAFDWCASPSGGNGRGIITIPEDGVLFSQAVCLSNNVLIEGEGVTLTTGATGQRFASGNTPVSLAANGGLLTTPGVAPTRDLDPVFDPALHPELIITVTASIREGDDRFQVNDVSRLVAGRYIMISSNAQPWNGSGNTSDGYFSTPVGELRQIRRVDLETKTVVVVGVIHENLTVGGPNGYVVYVKQFKPFLKNFGMRNINFQGPGASPTNPATSLYGIWPINLQTIDNVHLENLHFKDYMNQCGSLTRCINVRMEGGEVQGRPYESNVFDQEPTLPYGFGFETCDTVYMHHVRGRGLRRLADADRVNNDPPTRNMIIDSCSTIDCGDLFGGHLGCANIRLIGNQALGCSDPVYIRGKDMSLVGNELESIADDSDARSCVAFGYTSNASFPNEIMTVGKVEVIGNKMTSKRRCINFNNDVGSAKVALNTMISARGENVYFRGRNIKNVEFSDNHMEITDRGSSRLYNVVIQTSPEAVLATLNGLTFDGDTMLGGVEPFYISGTNSPDSPADNVLFKRVTVGPGGGGGVLDGPGQFRDGYFGENYGMRDSEMLGPVTRPTIGIDAANLHKYASLPEADYRLSDIPKMRIVARGQPLLFLDPLRNWRRGDAIENDLWPLANNYRHFVALDGGTGGSITAGTTGSGVPTGGARFTLSVNQNGRSGRDLAPGRYITVAGAGPSGVDLKTRIKAVAGLVLTLADPIRTAVTNAAMSFTPVVYQGWGLTSGTPPAAGDIAYEPETTALLARYPSPVPVTTVGSRADYQNRLIRRLKTPVAGQSLAPWDYLIALWIIAADRSDAALLNWVSGSFNLTAVNNPAIATDRYAAGDGSTSYFSTGLNLATVGNGIAPDGTGAAVSLYFPASAPESLNSMLGFSGNGNLRLVGRQQSNVISTRFADSTNTGIDAGKNGGHIGLSLADTSGYTVYQNGNPIRKVLTGMGNAFAWITSSNILIGRSAALYTAQPWMAARVSRVMPDAIERAFHDGLNEYLAIITDGNV